MSKLPEPIHSIIRLSAHHVDVLIRLTPNASRDEITGIVQTSESEARLAIKVRAVPEKGKANKAVTDYMAKQLSVAKSAVTVSSGTTSRFKTLRVEGESELIISALGRIS